jgi:hypothetical protein
LSSRAVVFDESPTSLAAQTGKMSAVDSNFLGAAVAAAAVAAASF